MKESQEKEQRLKDKTKNRKVKLNFLHFEVMDAPLDRPDNQLLASK